MPLVALRAENSALLSPVCRGTVTPAVTVVVPARSDEPSLPLTLPAIVRAARVTELPTEILLAVTIVPGAPPPTLVLDREVRVVTTAQPGKVAALHAAVREALGELLVLVDADVLPGAAAFRLVLEPLLADQADLCAGRPKISPRPGASGVARMLERWNAATLEAWHLLRTGHPSQRWALSGALYALRRALFPAVVLAPLVDDISIGLQALEAGGRFAYAPGAVVHVLAPTSYWEWLRRKAHVYRSVAGLRRLRRMEVDDLEATFRGCLRQAAGGGGVASWLLRYQLRVLHRAARVSARLRPPSSGMWTSAPSTKRWSVTQALMPEEGGPLTGPSSSCAAPTLRRPGRWHR
jgi:Glycosyltransferase like family 2